MAMRPYVPDVAFHLIQPVGAVAEDLEKAGGHEGGFELVQLRDR